MLKFYSVNVMIVKSCRKFMNMFLESQFPHTFEVVTKPAETCQLHVVG